MEKKNKKRIKIKKIVGMTCGKGGKWWEVSPTLINSGMRIKKGEGGKGKREKEEKKKDRERKKKGRKEKGDFFDVLTIKS